VSFRQCSLIKRFVNSYMPGYGLNDFTFNQDLDRFYLFQLGQGFNYGIDQYRFSFTANVSLKQFFRKIDNSSCVSDSC